MFEQINSIAQTVASFAVGGSFVYLAIQTRICGLRRSPYSSSVNSTPPRERSTRFVS